MMNYVVYILIRLLSFILQILPLNFSLWLARFFGSIFYYLDKKRKNIAYTNLKLAFVHLKTPKELKIILKKTYQNLAQDFIEVLRLPKVNKKYIDKFIEFNGLNNIDKALKNKKGVILLATHFGSWEMYFTSGPLKGYPLKILAREQKNKYLSNLLDNWRKSKGCEVLYRGSPTREIIRALRNNQIVGMVMDQGGRTEDVFTNFFGKEVMTPTGAVRIALDLGSAILPAYIRRKNGPYHEVVIMPQLNLVNTDNREKDIVNNLEKLNRIAEEYIRKYPEEYFWFHKRWKYSPDRWIIILSDGKAGHVRQSKAIAKLVEELGFQVTIKSIEIKFKNRFLRFLLNVCTFFTSQYCQGCMCCLKFSLEKKSYEELSKNFGDIVISCGSSLVSVNLFLSRELNARSIVIMKPGVLSVKRFNLVIAPFHDHIRGKNVVQTLITPNLIDKDYLENQVQLFLRNNPSFQKQSNALRIGVLIGGDTKYFSLREDIILELIHQIKILQGKIKIELLITTSRRTPSNIEELLKKEFSSNSLCKLLIVARENNISEAMGAILCLAQLVIVSGDSISMVSEAISSGKKVIIFKLIKSINKYLKHEIFLDELNRRKYIKLINIEELANTIENIKEEKVVSIEFEQKKEILEKLKQIL